MNQNYRIHLVLSLHEFHNSQLLRMHSSKLRLSHSSRWIAALLRGRGIGRRARGSHANWQTALLIGHGERRIHHESLRLLGSSNRLCLCLCLSPCLGFSLLPLTLCLLPLLAFPFGSLSSLYLLKY